MPGSARGERTSAPDRARLLRLDSPLLVHVAAVIALNGAVLTVLSGVGDDPQTVLIALSTATPFLVLSRPWRLPWWLLALAAAMPAAPLVISLAHAETAGIDRIGKYAYFAILLVSMLAWASSPARRLWLGFGVVALGLAELFPSLGFWIRSARPDQALLGLLGWTNQYADFELIPLAVAAFIAILGVDPLPLPRSIRVGLQSMAGASAALIGASILPTGSRYGIALGGLVLAAALAVSLSIAVRRRTWWPIVRMVLICVGIALVAIVLTSPLLFPAANSDGIASSSTTSPLHNLLVRSNARNGSFNGRTPLWEAALGMGAAHPLFGVGLLQFAKYAPCYAVQPLTALEWHPHDEWLYGWAEGGIVGLLPILALTLAVIVLAIRSLIPFPRPAAFVADAGRWGGLVAIAAATAALALEYDLYYPPILTTIAAAGGLAGAGAMARKHRTQASRRIGVAIFVLLAAFAVVGFIAVMIDPAQGGLPWVIERPYPSTCSVGP